MEFDAAAADCFFNLNKDVVNGDESIGVSDLTLLIFLNESVFNPDSNEKTETLVERLMQRNSFSADKLTRAQFRSCLGSYCLGPPTRSEASVVKNTKDIVEVQSIFLLWSGGKNQKLEHGDMSTVLSLFNKSSNRFHDDPSRKQTAGRMMINYYDRANWGYEINLTAFTKWIWEECKLLEEDFKIETVTVLKSLRQFVSLVRLHNTWDWQKKDKVEVEDFNKVIAAYNGEDFKSVDTSKRPPNGLPYYVATEPLGVKEFSLFLREGILGLGVTDFHAEVVKLEKIVMSKDILSQIVGAFGNYDVNGDGVISKKELQNVMSRIHDFKEEELDLLMEGADTNKDGRINYTEFAKWVLASISDTEQLT